MTTHEPPRKKRKLESLISHQDKCLAMFETVCPNHVNISTLKMFIDVVIHSYKENPYHSAEHAIDVMEFYLTIAPKLPWQKRSILHTIMLTTLLVHDAGHPGQVHDAGHV
eukprot:849469_1